ncbi:fasciclin domain-containing protein [Ilumatobacter sp.]|uniref:fasciclin domain-containing protein n=1 Tax=Ilumatobacter sp. TaxID=1967498 RepID=UPI003C5DBA9A
MNKRIIRFSAAIASVGLVVASCGSDSDDAATTDAPTEVTEAAEAPADTEAPVVTEAMTEGTEAMTEGTEAMTEDTEAVAEEESDIVDTAVAAGDFGTLVAAVQAAGLEETLRGDGPFTVFAPTDAAFAALPEGTVDTLLEDPSGDLTDILTYHVVAGEVPAADVVTLDGQEVETVQGGTFTVNIGEDGSVSLTDAAGNEVSVVATDVMAGNGVIHVIDAVLMPA